MGPAPLRHRPSTGLRVWWGGVLLLALAATVVVLWPGASGRELQHEGVPFSVWLRAGTNNLDHIDAALGKFGAAALPDLCALVQEQDSVLRRLWQKVWLRLPRAIRRHLPGPASLPAGVLRQRGLLALQRCGSEARPALPWLLALARRPPDLPTRLELLATLAAVGPDSAEVVSVLNQTLPDPVCGRAAAVALARCGPHAAPAVPGLVRSLQIALQSTNSLPFPELIALASIGPAATSALPVIVRATRRSELRPYALTALKWIGPAPEHVPLLAERLRLGTRQEAYLAAEALLRLGGDAHAARAELQAAAAGEDAVLGVLAAAVLARLDDDPAAAVPAMVRALRRGPGVVRGDALWTYHLPNSAFGPPSDAAAVLSLNHRGAAAWHLGEVGAAARDAVPALEEVMGKVGWESFVAAEALWKITGEPERVLPKLIAAAGGGVRQGQTVAIRLLGAIGPAAHPAVPVLLRVRSTSATLRREVNAALRRIQPSALAD